MAVLINAERGDDNEVMCSVCSAVFTIIWRRSADVIGINYCPFCGDELEDEITQRKRDPGERDES